MQLMLNIPKAFVEAMTKLVIALAIVILIIGVLYK